MTDWPIIIGAAYAAVLLAAAVSDARRYRIPNLYPALLVLLFVAARVAVFPFDAPLWSHLVHFGVALLVGMLLFHFRWFGGGDAKLYAAVALWFGIGDAIFLLFLTSVTGAIIVMFRIIFHILRGIGGGTGGSRQQLLARKIPYGIAIAAGGCASFAWLYL